MKKEKSNRRIFPNKLLYLPIPVHYAAKLWKEWYKLKLHKSSKEPEIYYYFNANEEKMWMFRHKYYNETGNRKEKKKRGFNTEKAALKSLLEVKTALLSGESKQVEYDQIAVGKWLDLWYETNKKNGNQLLAFKENLLLEFISSQH